jgi:hypothetical protein
MRKLLTGFVLLMLLTSVQAQQKNFWATVNKATLTQDVFANRERPKAFQVFSLNENQMGAALRQVPSEKNVRAQQSAFVLSIPDAEGNLRQFRVVDAPVMEPGLAAKYPGIGSYAGVAVDDPTTTIRFSMGNDGFHGMILTADHQTAYINPVRGANALYTVVARKNMHRPEQDFTCGTMATAANEINHGLVGRLAADDGRLRTFRLALCASGEYSQFWLDGTETTDAQRKAKVIAAMNTAMTRTNGIYERDFGIRMLLIANNDAVVYLNASTDPFTTSGSWNSQTQTTCTNVIGAANYDIGHAITYSAPPGNGNAGCIGCVCQASKGSGWTAYYDFASDFFIVDYFTHELGHQFGANHTFTYSNESGTGAQMEPGSGTTIMGYAGITGTNTDVQPHSDDYFHARSIDQVSAYIKSASASCAVTTITGNTAPTVNAGLDYTIPRSTPFALTGSGSDVDAGDVLTYTWEQINTGTSTTTIPSATATAGPVFRSRPNGTNPTRNFPILSSILDGTNGNKWEVLPSVARTLAFRLTIRDNHVGGGNANTDDMNVTISSATGPFAVTAPNTAVTWGAGTAQTVTWSVNGTNGAPVNCANVRILLSTDGGQTFPTVLAATTANDGSEAITVPTVNSTTCRVKVEAVGNIFFDISNANFTINGTPPACGDATGLAASSITNTSATVSWAAVSGAVSYDVDYKTAASATWINAATATASTSVALSGLTQGTLYDYRVRANCSGGSGNYVSAQFTTTAPASCNAPTGLASSAITSSGATVNWTAVSGAASYDVDYKAASSATWINAVTGTTSTSRAIAGLAASTLYDWRVRANCTAVSLTSAYTQAQFTTAAVSTCPGPLDVSTNGTASGAATIPFNTDVRGLISPSGDNDYYRFVITTGGTATITLGTLPADYDIRLYSSNGTTQLAISQAGGTSSETISRTYTAGTYFVRVYGYQNANNATQCYTLRVQLGTAARVVEPVTPKADVVSIYPNPVRNELKVNMGVYTAPVTVTVTDMYGRRIATQSFANTASISTAKMASGVYMVTVTDQKGMVIKQDKITKE